MRAEREAIGRQLQQERRRAEADDLRLTAAAAAREVAAGVAAGLEAELAQQGVQRGATAAEEAELRLQAEQAPQGELAALQRLVERSTSLKLQQTDFKKQCKAQLQQLQQQRKAQLDDLAEEGAEGGDSQLAKMRRVERLFEAESSKADQMRRLLGQKGRQIASLQRQIDEIPTRAELMQYERRFRELYQQLVTPALTLTEPSPSPSPSPLTIHHSPFTLTLNLTLTRRARVRRQSVTTTSTTSSARSRATSPRRPPSSTPYTTTSLRSAAAPPLGRAATRTPHLLCLLWLPCPPTPTRRAAAPPRTSSSSRSMAS
eukprot:scaffold887_cov27-Phaeocystis_antarctica.AAC.1